MATVLLLLQVERRLSGGPRSRCRLHGAPDAGGSHLDATAFAVLAMAQHRLGRREQAFAALDKAEAIVAKKMPDPGSGRPFGGDWDDWLRCRILLDEARKLMKKDTGAKNQESGNKPD